MIDQIRYFYYEDQVYLKNLIQASQVALLVIATG